jgi:hypothetical protein
MITMNENELIPRLISEYKYPPKGAQIVAEKLVNSSQQVNQAFNVFWETGEVPELEVEGYTISRLVKEHRMTPIAALLTLDWLIRDPEHAKKSLKKGHDIVGKSDNR